MWAPIGGGKNNRLNLLLGLTDTILNCRLHPPPLISDIVVPFNIPNRLPTADSSCFRTRQNSKRQMLKLSRRNNAHQLESKTKLEKRLESGICLWVCEEGYDRRLTLAQSRGKMRPIFVGNFEYDTRQSDLERLFSKYGRVERVDMKSGFAFVYFEDERDAEDAVRGLDNIPFGYDRRRLSVEWARGERGRHRDGSRAANQRATKSLFVINFDPIRTRVRDLERHFEPYGKVLSVRIRRNFAFVQFDTQEDATKALECTHLSKLLDRVISVEYALRDDDERDDRFDSPRRGYGRRGDSPYRRSPSPALRRGRPSPDYGQPRSPVYDRYDGPAHGRQRSPVYGRYRSRSPNQYMIWVA
ncbi:hypothetical protein Nepgr_023601 [Nepenthes gracilis]|uniref:RRM domain-containing protein n=1 Tax=Nepenthes gracilis TaxID=150966 RepID=A0AAD3T346_NEPGR|nr:hypothetical protein Nepgr_023601 [Nepenthes gracilis]